MNQQGQKSERRRRDWIIILIILLIGFLCVIVAGERAVRFSPYWKLDTNMQSNLDPDSDFLTNRPVSFYEPLDPAILTQPVWINIFLTPGALFQTRTPIPATNPPAGTITPAPTILISPTPTSINPTNTPTTGPSPTNTLIYYPPPPPTITPKPPPSNTPTNTPITPLPTADLVIIKNDGGLIAVDPNDTITYTVRVTNNGPNSVTGAILSDPVASGLSKTAVACSPTPSQCAIPPTIAELESGSFALPALNNGEFYEITITTDVTATSGSVTNTATVTAPAGFTDPAGNNAASDTNTVNLVADLRITKDDGAAAYESDSSITYTINVYNDGPSDVTGARVQDTFTMAVDSINWTCTASGVGAACGNSSGSGDIDELVDLPASTSVTYQVIVDVAASETSNLTNTATVTPPTGVTDPTPGNNSASDPNPDVLIVSSGTGYINIGTAPDYSTTVIPEGSSVTLNLSSAVVVNNALPPDGFDLIYYELPFGTGIAIDQVLLEISDGSNWYPVFYWGDGIADTNSNLNIAIIGGIESDNRDFTTIPASDILYPFGTGTLANPATGVTIELENYVPNGTYLYIRITAMGPPAGDGVEVDAIYVVP